MTLPESFERAFGTHDAYERNGDAFVLTTTRFDGRVTAAEHESHDWKLRYNVTVRAPMLSTVANDQVGPAVEEGWFETYERRLEDAAGAVRESVDVDDEVFESDGDAVAVFEFEWADADRAAEIAKALVEYAEGTYVEGVVPGYEYGDPVASMLSQATQGEGDGSRGGTPL
jgi:hypothetical protein